jgi:2-amino-4-hydroxy-6-hydroxymethyldihydropteridine diphosphokinase
VIKKYSLDEHYKLIVTKHYPYSAPKISRRRKRRQYHKALIGVGGNTGDVLRRFEHLFWVIKRSNKATILSSAPILLNPPFGILEQPYFYNTLLLLRTSLSPIELLDYLQHIENKFRRKRVVRNGPRTLDLDIIFYDDIQMDSPRLKIPHPEWMKRDSVLIPMKYMKGRR